MKEFKKATKGFSIVELLILIVVVVCLTWGFLFVSGEIKMAKVDPAMAAVPIPSPASPGYMMTVLPVPGSYTTGNATNAVRFKMPWDCTLLGFHAIAKTTGSGAMTADVKVAGTSFLTTPISFKSTTMGLATLGSTVAIPAGSMIGINFAVTGAGTWTNPTVSIFMKRK